MQQVVHALAGQRGTSQAIDLVRGLGRLRIDTALDDFHGQQPLLVEQGLAGPQRLPLRIVHLTTQTRGLTVLVEAEADYGIEVALDGNKAVQGRPQTVAAHRQDQGVELAVGFHHIHGGKPLAALDRSDVLRPGEGIGQRWILGRLKRVEAGGVLGFTECAGLQVNHAGLDAFGIQRLDRCGRHIPLAQTGNRQNAALLVQLAVFHLGRFQRHSCAGDEHRADQAHQYRHSQGADGRFLLSHGRASA